MLTTCLICACLPREIHDLLCSQSMYRHKPPTVSVRSRHIISQKDLKEDACLSVLPVDVDTHNGFAEGWIGRFLQIIVNVLLVLHCVESLQ